MSIKLMTRVWDMPKEVIKQGPKLVLLALCDYANDEGECYPSQDKLAVRASCTDRSVRDHLDWLESIGVISVSRRQTGGRRKSDLYHIDLLPLLKSEAEKSSASVNQSEAENFSSTHQSEPEKNSKAKRKTFPTLPEEFSGCYISGTVNEPSIEPSMIDMGAGADKLSDKQIAEWVISLGWTYGINTSNPALVESIALGVLTEDLNYTLAEMQANNAGSNWKYFCKVLRTTVQQRLQAAQTLPAVDGLPNKRGAPAQANTVAADVDLLVAGGVDVVVAEQWVAYRQSRRAGMLTQVFLDGLVQEGKSLGLGMSLHDVVVWCVSKGQVRFEAAWLVKEQETGKQGPQGVAYREFEPEPVVSAEEKQQKHAQGKLRSKELLARTKELLAGKAV